MKRDWELIREILIRLDEKEEDLFRVRTYLGDLFRVSPFFNL